MIFKPRARLLLQLGDELIRNEGIALLELVKNSYDADATEVSLVMNKVDQVEEGTIVIEDNGTGMDLRIITEVWMEPGSNYKRELYEKKERTKKFGRAVLGEKGIGRFAAHKLGNEIELISKKMGHKEVYLKFNWNIFAKTKYLKDVPIEVLERAPEVFKGNKTGTRIVIRKLTKLWNRGVIRDVYRSWNSLCSPFDSPHSFRITFETDKKEWLEGLMSWEEIKEHALFRFRCDVQGDRITKFYYKFQPWKTMKKLQSREVTENDERVRKLLKIRTDEGKPLDLSNYEIGKFRFEGLIFDRDLRVLSLGIQDKTGFKNYLDSNGGVRVYRDGVRVYDFGEPGNDWLNLDLRRVNIPTFRISNNIIIASVSLKREQSRDLVEKTNREGFVENEAGEPFRQAILYALNVVETQRSPDKDKIRKFYGPTPRTEPVISKIDELKKTVEKKIKDKAVKKEITGYLNRIEEDYKYVNDTLLRSAGAGLSLSVVIHEVEKIVDELNQVIEKEETPTRITKLVKHLSRLLEGYTLIVRKSAKQFQVLHKLVDQAIFNMEYRFKAHEITIIQGTKEASKSVEVRCARNLIVATMMNAMDNSIYWLDYNKTPKKKILISISDDLPGFTSIVIADNGFGFTLPVEEMVKPFVTAKSGGMGLGLHIAKEIMTAHGGELIFPEWGDFNIPKEFEKGAIVALAFRKETKK